MCSRCSRIPPATCTWGMRATTPMATWWPATAKHAGLRRAASHGLGRLRPARGERRHQASQPSGHLDLREHRDPEEELLTRMGFSYDWDRKVVACDPEYYRWGQWIFLKFWERGLVERRNSPVNWCPSCGYRARQRAGHRRVAAGDAIPRLRSATSPSGTTRSPTTPRSCWTTWISSKAGPSA